MIGFDEILTVQDKKGLSEFNEFSEIMYTRCKSLSSSYKTVL